MKENKIDFNVYYEYMFLNLNFELLFPWYTHTRRVWTGLSFIKR